MKSAYVIGLGKSGIAAARLLQHQGWAVTVSDRNHADHLQSLKASLEQEGIAVLLGHTFEPDPATMQRVVVSPGVPWDLPSLIQGRAAGIEMMGEMELAWRSLHAYPWVAITGTNGKTTVTSLIAAIFQAAGLNAPACGNIGNAACDLARETLFPPSDSVSLLDWVVAEVSSYQIEAAPSLSPRIGLWTTFTPDHLSRHKTLDNYYTIKASLLRRAEIQVLNGDDPHLRNTGGRQWPEAIWTSTAGRAALVAHPEQGAYIESGWAYVADEKILPVNSLRMVGQHNRQNLLMAIAAARLAGIASEAIAQAIATFPGVPHRLEHICTWKGIDFINDSKATNYDASEVGLRAVEGPAILIAGGEAKDGDDTTWLRQIQQKVATVLLIGEAAPAFSRRLTEIGYDAYETVETMEKAVPRAAELATQLNGRVVLLSPACASFDQYANFEQRGDHFRQICQEYLG